MNYGGWSATMSGGPSPLAQANDRIAQLEQKINAMTEEHDNEVVALKAQIALNQRAADFYESEGWRVLDDAFRDAETELTAARRSAAAWQRSAEWWRGRARKNGKSNAAFYVNYLRWRSIERRIQRRGASTEAAV